MGDDFDDEPQGFINEVVLSIPPEPKPAPPAEAPPASSPPTPAPAPAPTPPSATRTPQSSGKKKAPPQEGQAATPKRPQQGSGKGAQNGNAAKKPQPGANSSGQGAPREQSGQAAQRKSQPSSKPPGQGAPKAQSGQGGAGAPRKPQPSSKQPGQGAPRAQSGQNGGAPRKPQPSSKQPGQGAPRAQSGQNGGAPRKPQPSSKQPGQGAPRAQSGQNGGAPRKPQPSSKQPGQAGAGAQRKPQQQGAGAPKRKPSAKEQTPGNQGGFGMKIVPNQAASMKQTPGNAGGFGMKLVPKDQLGGGQPRRQGSGAVPVVQTNDKSRPPARRPQNAKPAPPRARRISQAVTNFFGLDEEAYVQRRPAPTTAMNPAAAMMVASDPKKPKAPVNHKLVKGKEALQEYQKFIKKEKDWKSKQPGYNKYGMTTKTMQVKTATADKMSHEEMMREELLSLPEFSPIFINFITFVQFVVFLGMVFKALVDGDIAKWGFVAEGSTCSGDNCPLSANSSVITGAVKVEPVNPWLGPSSTFLVKFNSKYSPCMRNDVGIDKDLTIERNRECCSGCDPNQAGSPFQTQCDAEVESDGVTPSGYSCCAMPNSLQLTAASSNDPQNTCSGFFPNSGIFNGTKMVTTANGRACLTASLLYGMTSYRECEGYNGVWMRSGNINLGCSENSGRITLRPCCIGHKSECQLLTETQCTFEAGIYHSSLQLCGQTPCLAETCTTYAGVTETGLPKPTQNKIEEPNQWYRFIAPLFVHSGAIQVILVLYLQQVIGCPIERSIGWLRMFLVYFISGIGGYMVSGVLDPYVVSCGANPAVFGLFALMTVELFQSWEVVPNRCWHLFKLLALILVGFVVGSLPFVDNMAQLGGFSFGLVSAVIFLPYVAFGKWHARARKLMLLICFPLLLVMVIVGIVMFYTVQFADCPWCGDFNCWQWTSDISCDGD